MLDSASRLQTIAASHMEEKRDTRRGAEHRFRISEEKTKRSGYHAQPAVCETATEYAGTTKSAPDHTQRGKEAHSRAIHAQCKSRRDTRLTCLSRNQTSRRKPAHEIRIKLTSEQRKIRSL